MNKFANKRLIISIVAVFLLSIFSSQFSILAKAEEPQLDLNADAAILIDANSGKILYEKNADVMKPIASMSKMMTEYLVLEAINKGKISWDTTTKISKYAFDISANPSFSGVGLRLDFDYKVRDLYKAMAINSDNATTITLAELVAGSEANFVKMMNDKAKELGLTDYQFVNSTGLANTDLGENYPEGTEPDGESSLSARSVALLAYHLIKDYPEVLETSSVPQTEFEDQTIINWNWMLPNSVGLLNQFSYDGVDGLKTGFTEEAGYCFTGTAKKNGMRLISVVMNTASKEARFQETKKLFDYGFHNFKEVEIFPKGYQLKNKKTIPVIKGKEKSVEIATNEAISLLIPHDIDKKSFKAEYVLDEKLFTKDGELKAPIKKGTKVGYMKISSDDLNYGYIKSTSDNALMVDLITKKEVEKANWFVLTMRGIGGFFSDVWNGIMNTIKG